MGSKKNKGTKTIVDSRSRSVQPSGSDMSKYARAVSNKSKIDYAALKLVRHEYDEQKNKSENEVKPKGKASDKAAGGKTQDKSREKKKAAGSKGVGTKEKKKSERAKKTKDKPSPEKKASRKAAPVQESKADERYSNALGSGDHYSSAVEKYYLKYPDKKRPKKRKADSPAKNQAPKSRRKRGGSSGEASNGQQKRSMAEIAVSNKHSASVRKHALAARNAKARGVISPKVGNRSFYRRKKKKPGAFNVLMITLLLVFMVSVGVLVFFHIGQIRIEGESPYTEAQIKSMCSFGKGSNILFIDSAGTERRITTELPYIEKCTVERRLPSTVVIHVEKADVLGVAQGPGGQWAVLSTGGKILETSASNGVSVKDDDGNTDENADGNEYVPGAISSAEEISAMRLIPLLTDIDYNSGSEDGFLTGEALEKLKVLTDIRDAFAEKEMKLTSAGSGGRGYEAVYDGRITLIFGKETDRRTLFHHMDEIYDIIFNQKVITENDKGEFRFINGMLIFRRQYDVSEEALKSMNQQKREKNQKKLYSLAEIFMSTGKDWFEGKLRTE